MAISLKATGAWVENTAAGPTVTLVGTPAAGDRHYIWATWKTFSITASMPGTWTEVTEFADGAVATGAGLGSMKVACWYRDWQLGDANPVLTFSTATSLLSGIVCQLWQKGAGENWDTPVFKTAAWPVTSTAQTVNASSSGVVPDGSVVMCLAGFRDDLASITRTTTSLSASPALTWNGNYVESPATHRTSTTGNDQAADLGHRFVTTGHAATTLSMQATISTVETGAILWVVQGLAAGGQLLEFTETDDVGVIDALTIAGGRTQIDPVNVTDTVAVTQDWVRDQADPVGIADTAEFAIILVADAVDTVGVTDTLTVVADYVRTQTDPVDIIDVLITDAGRTQVDSIGITDSAEFAISLSIDATDAVGIADTLITDAGRTQTDPIGVTDTSDVTQDWVRTQTDPVAITDTAEVIISLIIDAIDAVGISDSLTLGHDVTVADSVDLVDSLALDRSVDQTDPVGVTDTAEVIISLIVDATDPVGVTDTSTVTADYVRTETDPVDLTDTLSLQRDITEVDLIGVTDAATFEISLVADATNLVDTTDAATFLAGYVRAFTDPIGITDTATFALGALEAAEPIGIADTAQFYPWASTDRTTLVDAGTRTTVADGERSTVAVIDARTTYPSNSQHLSRTGKVKQ